MDVNKVFLGGRLGKDPVLNETGGGKKVANFSIATKFGEKTQWTNVVAWEKQAELCAQHLHKGSTVLVEGRLETRSYEKDGKQVYVTEVVASSVHFVGGGQSTSTQSTTQANSDDDVPF